MRAGRMVNRPGWGAGARNLIRDASSVTRTFVPAVFQVVDWLVSLESAILLDGSMPRAR